jgi:DTW domain-containing protein YfiP
MIRHFVRCLGLWEPLLAALLVRNPTSCNALLPATSKLQLLQCPAHGRHLFSTSPLPASKRISSELSIADDFLKQVEETVERVLSQADSSRDIMDLEPAEREALGVARHLDRRLVNLRRNNDCPSCWMQRKHCICQKCKPVDTIPKSKLGRIFLLMHHKEIGLKIDTAKLILASFPTKCRLVVGGIGPDYQDSMKELQQALEQNKQCLVLFPDDSAKTFAEIVEQNYHCQQDVESNEDQESWDLIVIDGTWAQARKLNARYLPEHAKGGPRRVQLSPQAVAMLERETTDGSANAGHQLRRHSTTWRQVGTFEATRLFLRDLLLDDYPDSLPATPWGQMEFYQEIANEAARKELGPPRL